MIQSSSISILGYGWLGKPLAKKLLDIGFTVKASTTTVDKLVEIEQNGIQPFHIDLNPETDVKLFQQFLNSEILYINIPPGMRKNPDSNLYIKQLQFIGKHIGQSIIQKVILISTTSVYPEGNKEYSENDINNQEQSGNTILYQAEQIVMQWNIDYCILRMGGLVGYDRNLLKYFAGKTGLQGGNTPVNLIHRDDCIKIIIEVIQKKAFNKIYNCCSPQHPTRKIFYSNLANRYFKTAPQYIEEDQSTWKIINSDKLISELQYQFLYPNPLEYTYT
jgi:nucleoside-diphosphate-sugar epimerase